MPRRAAPKSKPPREINAPITKINASTIKPTATRSRCSIQRTPRPPELYTTLQPSPTTSSTALMITTPTVPSSMPPPPPSPATTGIRFCRTAATARLNCGMHHTTLAMIVAISHAQPNTGDTASLINPKGRRPVARVT